MLIIGSPFMFPPGTMLSAMERLGLTNGLKFCLDAGDINSYSGAGQSWLDTSGNGHDFLRGTTSGAEATDPTFNGSAGGQSSAEYWSFDGGDLFRYDSLNETWMNNIHKNNAIWAFAGWVYVASLPGTAAPILGTGEANASLIGASAVIRSTGALRIIVVNTDGVDGALLVTSSATVNTNVWNFLAGQINEPAGTGFLQVNGTQEDITSTYNTPSASNASRTLEIGRDGSGATAIFPNGYRMNGLSMWEASIPTKSQMLEFYNATKGKFGL